MDCVALPSIEICYFFSEAVYELGVNDAGFLFEFSYNRVFFAFIWLDVAFYEVPVSSLIPKKEVDDFDVFHEDNGAA